MICGEGGLEEMKKKFLRPFSGKHYFSEAVPREKIPFEKFLPPPDH